MPGTGEFGDLGTGGLARGSFLHRGLARPFLLPHLGPRVPDVTRVEEAECVRCPAADQIRAGHHDPGDVRATPVVADEIDGFPELLQARGEPLAVALDGGGEAVRRGHPEAGRGQRRPGRPA
jgi:hypothetical protein